MSTKKEKKLVGEGDFTIIRETARYIESLSDNSFECGRLVGQSWRLVSVKNFEKIAIVSDSGNITPPCGICRQVLLEFMPEGMVVLENELGEIKTYSVKELLPIGFTL